MDGGTVRSVGGHTPGGSGGGRLTIAGSGIKAVAHLTQETVGHIRGADIVFYKVIDGASAAFIRGLNPNAVDLSQYYGDDKRRRITYIQMAEVMLREVRAGRNVVGVFYGHPGFYVDPARRALAVAAREGYPTEMLPGVSSLDTLFADLRIDPAQHGCQMLEATDLLLRDRQLATSGHVIILQVGSVGDLAFNFAHGFRHNKRAVLFDRLIETYGPDHGSILYLAASLPGVAPRMIRRPLGDYRDPAVLAAIHPASTLYIQPHEVRPTDPGMAERLGAQWVLAPAGNRKPSLSGYGELEREAVDALPAHAVSPHYRPHLASPALFTVVSRLALDPGAGRSLADFPERFLAEFPDLTEGERQALLSRDASRLVTAMMAPGRGNVLGDKPDKAVPGKSPEKSPAAPLSDTDISVTEEEIAPLSDTDISVTEEEIAPMSDTDLSVTEEEIAPMSDTDLRVTEETVPLSDTDISVTEEQI